MAFMTASERRRAEIFARLPNTNPFLEEWVQLERAALGEDAAEKGQVWSLLAGQAYDRLGVEEFRREIMGVDIPVLLMPVAPGRNISNLIEVGVRNHLLKLKGVNRARELVDRLDENLLRRGQRG